MGIQLIPGDAEVYVDGKLHLGALNLLVKGGLAQINVCPGGQAEAPRPGIATDSRARAANPSGQRNAKPRKKKRIRRSSRLAQETPPSRLERDDLVGPEDL